MATRFTRPWPARHAADTPPFVTADAAGGGGALLPPLAATRGRAYVSSLPHEMTDGLGYRAAYAAFDLNAAALLGVAYVHRWGAYGSLTVADPTAVERLFGWGGGGGAERLLGGPDGVDGGRGGGGGGVPLRRQVYAAACAEVAEVADACGRPRVTCVRLRAGGGGGFRRLVTVPARLLAVDAAAAAAAAAAAGGGVAAARSPPLVAFLDAHDEAGTLFQLGTDDCYYQLPSVTGWSLGVRQRLSDMYWARRALEAADPAAATRGAWLAARDAADAAFPPASVLPPPRAKPPPARTPAPPAAAAAAATPAAAAAAADGGVTFPLDPSRVHIVAHVRRGDFLLATPAARRRMVLADAAYVGALRAVVTAVAAAEGAATPEHGGDCASAAAAPASDAAAAASASPGDAAAAAAAVPSDTPAGRPPLRFTVHVLSQGVAKPNVSIWSSHDAAHFTSAYADENGTAHGAGYWAKVVGAGWDAATVRDAAAAAPPPPTAAAATRNRSVPPLDVVVAEHISAPTLRSIGTMLAADVLLASASAMSEGLGTTAGRGVLVLPSRPPRGVPGVATWAAAAGDQEGGGGGEGAAAEPGGVDAPALRRAWREYRRVTPLGGWGCGRV